MCVNDYKHTKIGFVYGKEKVYKAFVQKLTYHYNGQNSVYKNLGITYLAPDYESLSHIKDVAKNSITDSLLNHQENITNWITIKNEPSLFKQDLIEEIKFVSEH